VADQRTDISQSTVVVVVSAIGDLGFVRGAERREGCSRSDAAEDATIKATHELVGYRRGEFHWWGIHAVVLNR
jgi:hypothetical protein